MDDQTDDAARAGLRTRISALLAEADGLDLHLVAAHLDSALNALATQEPQALDARREPGRPLH